MLVLPLRRANAIALLTFFVLHFPASAQETGTPSFDEVVKHLAPSVVHITGFMGQEGKQPYANASGFFIDQSGYLITVPDVFTDTENRRLCERYVVNLFDGRTREARIFSVDPLLNLAVLKMFEPGRYPAIDTKPRVRVRPGDEVLALAGGIPGKPVPYTAGYVKARHKKSIYSAGFGDMLINIRMRLPIGAYGGPLLNEHGDVIGISTRNVHTPDPRTADPDESHALPSRIIMSFFKVSGTYPTSEQNWIGLAVRPLSPEKKNAVYKTLGQRAGVHIDFVWPDGPADQSDIQPGDILFEMNGTALTDVHRLNKLLVEAITDNTAEFAILRENRGILKKIKVEKRPPWAAYVK